MRFSTTTAVLTFLGITSAVPTPVELAPRCGTTLQPSIVQQLQQSYPAQSYPNRAVSAGGDGYFEVGQSSAATNRKYMIVAFSSIPAGSYGCSLGVAFPAGYPLSSNPGSPSLNVKTLYKDTPASITTPNSWSWNTFFPPSSPPLGQGVYGTTSLTTPQSATINTNACPPGGGSLAFIVSLADWISGPAGVSYKSGVSPQAGFYLTHNC
ncbi:hypothetical protein BJ875DRAFT_37751 [Amylocarpus encephaloides]|uniref:Ubiquitin 3 binding protein But2 C-terminal domain-containing protein n=1 Tax=Amylocarpus encephaloides TaxID=45428 RepID=A0A9P7YH35_9HELO|nr:hypothetical protein BJ875DRAFT_37751 [Amylocarpus encephaloides]